MATKAIVSYDGTANDRDALALGELLSRAGVVLVLAYVRHASRDGAHEADSLLQGGAIWLGNPDVARRVVLSGSTPEGLQWLSRREDAALVIFGSDYRTPAGRVAPQHSTESLLDGGAPAVAIAPAGYAQLEPRLRSIALFAASDDVAARETAGELAESFDATLTRAHADMLVIGSRPEAQLGTVMISAAAERAIEDAASPVLVVPRGVPIRFPQYAALV